MAKLYPADSLSFEKLVEWPDWKKCFTRHRTATKLDKDYDPVHEHHRRLYSPHSISLCRLQISSTRQTPLSSAEILG
ncbi:hypothetical protein CHARACLAT_020794 [Characodon lateralis]|uniref:Uncharacterized protein n=1 Tax=Characodon lateralis TaxID=208331 RepID=A0ABU7E2I5_9TELE|nr:hypothetical protein [Characodon lateralis]